MFTVTVETQRDDYKRRGGQSWSFVTENEYEAKLVAAREILSYLDDNDFNGLDGWEDYFITRDPFDVWRWYEKCGDTRTSPLQTSFFEGEYVPWRFRVTITEKENDFEKVNMDQMEKWFDALNEIYGDLE